MVAEHGYFEHPKRPYVFIHIPKNASSAMKQNLIRSGYEFHEGATDKKAMALVRDPIERYISGVYEYWSKNSDMSFPAFIESVEHPQIFDEHTRPQSDFLEDFQNVELFPMEMASYVSVVLTNKNRLMDINRSDALNYESFFNKGEIIKFYKKDYELWKKTLASLG